MPKLIEGLSRTLGEFLLLPGLTRTDCMPEKVDLRAPLVAFRRGEEPSLKLSIPVCSAIMQAVSGERMGIELARAGGLSFIFCSQSIDSQAGMVRRVKKYKAGFVVSDANVRPEATLEEILRLHRATGHSTIAVTADGTAGGRCVGLMTSRDFAFEEDMAKKAAEMMTPLEKLITGKEGLTLKEANQLIKANKVDVLPILAADGRLTHLVFRKDYANHKTHPGELLDDQKRLVVGAGVNTRDYKDRIPALVEAGADILCIDSSDGYSEWQAETIAFVRERYGDKVKIGAGNVVDADGFVYLADAGADFVKVGVGGGSICITREQKGIGRGQASAIAEVCEARDLYFAEKGKYVPVCSDGGIVHDYHMIIALALGADFLMLGRYFARFDESPSALVKRGHNVYKEYWGEGSNRARNWQRYDHGAETADGSKGMVFEEGVDSYVPYAGALSEGLAVTLAKLRATLCNCGSLDLKSFSRDAKLTLVSPLSLVEGSAHDVVLRNETSERIG